MPRTTAREVRSRARSRSCQIMVASRVVARQASYRLSAGTIIISSAPGSATPPRARSSKARNGSAGRRPHAPVLYFLDTRRRSVRADLHVLDHRTILLHGHLDGLVA